MMLSAMKDHKSNALTKLGPDLALLELSAGPAEAEAPDENIDLNLLETVECMRVGGSGLI